MRDIRSPLDGFVSPFGRVRGGLAPFSPAVLFANNEPGVWYDPSDLTTLFQDVAGTTPVTTPGQTVALMLDKSGNDRHATQSITAARPTYGIVPAGGRRNLLLRTEEFDNAVWGKVGTTTPVSLGDGVFRLDGFGDALGDRLLQTISISPSTLTAQFQVKGEGLDIGKDVQITAKRASGGTSTFNSQIITLTGDWQTVTTTFTMAADNVAAGIYFTSPNNSASAPLVRSPQLEVGSTATAYQRVSTAFDVTEAGVPSLGYLSFDGIDDWMVTPTITPGIDKVQVFAGVRKLSTASGWIAETGTGGQTGSLAVFANYLGSGAFTNVGAVWAGASTGTTTRYVVSPTNYAAPIANAISLLEDTSANLATLRIDGTQVAQSTANQGTSDYLAYPMHIGSRAGTSLRFNGQIYSLITRFGANLDTAQIAITEAYVAGKTAGVTI